MSEVIRKHAVELLWKQWTAIGVAGVPPLPEQAIDLEALIAFTPYVASADPRLDEECIDWCARIGRNFVSVSRLRQIVRLMPARSSGNHAADLASMLIDKTGLEGRRLSGKSRPPELTHPSLLQLRSRYVFGVGARADVISSLVMRARAAGPQRISAIRPTGYTKQAVATVLDELAQAAILDKLVRPKAISYLLVKEGPLRSLLAPLPKRMPSWTERFVIVANILETWARLGTRSTYAIELAKVLAGLRSLAASIGQQPPISGPPKLLLEQIDSWATRLLDDNVWSHSWIFGGEDISSEILDALSDELVAVVQSGDHPTGHTELEELIFQNVDRKSGTAEFHVQFTAEHPSEDFSFNGHVEGTFHFDPHAKAKEALLESIELVEAQEHFDMGAPDDG
jgi:hypothetical protein